MTAMTDGQQQKRAFLLPVREHALQFVSLSVSFLRGPWKGPRAAWGLRKTFLACLSKGVGTKNFKASYGGQLGNVYKMSESLTRTPPPIFEYHKGANFHDFCSKCAI